MTSRARPAVLAVLVASALCLTGCFGPPQPSPQPSAQRLAAALPSPTATPLAVPTHAPDELARTVFTAEGPDGTPATSGEVFAAPVPGVDYAVNVVCTSASGATPLAFQIRSADPHSTLLMGGAITCDGTPVADVGELATDAPPQIVLGSTEGVSEAFVSVTPATAGETGPQTVAP